MSRWRFVALTIVTAFSPIAVAGGGIAAAQAPSPGDSCTVLHATTQDANGRTMWCNPTMTGDQPAITAWCGNTADRVSAPCGQTSRRATGVKAFLPISTDRRESRGSAMRTT